MIIENNHMKRVGLALASASLKMQELMDQGLTQKESVRRMNGEVFVGKVREWPLQDVIRALSLENTRNNN